MDLTQKVKKPMTKEEVALVIDLIQSTPILTSKETNASTNRSKDEAWTTLAHAFNARSGSVPRTKEQLKLKWDNLKKAARKRSQLIRMNQFKTGVGKPDYIPPDEILEKVSGLLGSTCTGFDVPFGGDGTGGRSVVLDLGGAAHVGVVDVDIASDNAEEYNIVSLNDTNATSNSTADLAAVAETPTCGIQESKIKWDAPRTESSKCFFGTPLSKQLKAIKRGKKNANNDVDQSIIRRNLAIASLYDKRKEKLELEIKLLQLELSQKEKSSLCMGPNILYTTYKII